MSPTAPLVAPGRDVGARWGRPKSASTTYYSLPGVTVEDGSGTGSFQPSNATDTYFPLYTPTPLVVDQLMAEVTTLHAANNFRMGIYRSNQNLQPVGPPLVDSGDISTGTTGVKTYTPGTPLVLRPGPFLTVFNTTSTTAAYRGIKAGTLQLGLSTTNPGNPARNLYVARAYAAFPTPGTPWDTADANNTALGLYFVFLRVSAP